MAVCIEPGIPSEYQNLARNLTSILSLGFGSSHPWGQAIYGYVSQSRRGCFHLSPPLLTCYRGYPANAGSGSDTNVSRCRMFFSQFLILHHQTM